MDKYKSSGEKIKYANRSRLVYYLGKSKKKYVKMNGKYVHVRSKQNIKGGTIIDYRLAYFHSSYNDYVDNVKIFFDINHDNITKGNFAIVRGYLNKIFNFLPSIDDIQISGNDVERSFNIIRAFQIIQYTIQSLVLFFEYFFNYYHTYDKTSFNAIAKKSGFFDKFIKIKFFYDTLTNIISKFKTLLQDNKDTFYWIESILNTTYIFEMNLNILFELFVYINEEYIKTSLEQLKDENVEYTARMRQSLKRIQDNDEDNEYDDDFESENGD
jgi:hypothetical protein